MALELKTTRAADGAMTNHAPGAPSGGFGDPRALFAALINKRLQGTPAPAGAGAGATAPSGARAAAPRSYGSSSSGPQLGTQQTSRAPVAPARVTRQRKLQGTQDPFAVSSWAGNAGKLLNPGTMVNEYQLPDGSWSLDAVHGTLEGNEAAARAHQQNVYRDGGGASFAPGSDSRMASLVAQQNAARYGGRG